MPEDERFLTAPPAVRALLAHAASVRPELDEDQLLAWLEDLVEAQRRGGSQQERLLGLPDPAQGRDPRDL